MAKMAMPLKEHRINNAQFMMIQGGCQGINVRSCSFVFVFILVGRKASDFVFFSVVFAGVSW
jgi:hypothetical protein